jgi:hypothetical protein
MLASGFGYVYLFIPETKGLSLEEVRRLSAGSKSHSLIASKVDEMYRSGVKPWNSAGWTPHLIDRMHEKEKAKEVRESDEKQGA